MLLTGTIIPTEQISCTGAKLNGPTFILPNPQINISFHAIPTVQYHIIPANKHTQLFWDPG
jgi:hypothetical protein